MVLYQSRHDATEYGRLAQLVEHLLDVQEVTGSSPVPSTTSPDHSVWGFFVVCGTEREPEQVKAGYHHSGVALPFILSICQKSHPINLLFLRSLL